MTTATQTRWLTADEQRSWRAWITASHLLTDRLQRELQESHGLTLADYELLVQLSESEGRRLRMSALAERALSSRSRLSHQVSRMEAAGLVRREDCSDDRRGAFAVLTDKGWKVLVDAAPTHVEGVRTHLLDQMSAKDFAELGALCTKVADHLSATDD